MDNDFALEQQAIDRRRKLAEALMQSGMQMPQGGMVGRVYVGAHPLQQLAQVLRQRQGAEGMAAADDEARALSSRRNQMLAQWLSGQPQASQNAPADGVGPTQTRQPTRQEMQAWALRGMNVAPELATQMAVKYGMPEAPIKLGANETLIDPVTKQPIFSRPDVRTTGGNIFREKTPGSGDYEQVAGAQPKAPEVKRVHLGNGMWQDFGFDPKTNDFTKRVGEPYQNLPSASRVTATAAGPKIEVKTGESLAGQVGGIMKDSTAAAQGAIQQMDAARRIVEAVNSGKVIAGPGATPRMKIAQLGRVMGINGTSDDAVIEQTRATIRGLAEFSVSARKQLQGQGQITENEQKLLDRATTGDIDSLTDREIAQVARLTDRAARLVYQQHERRMQTVRGNPSYSPLAPFYETGQAPGELPADAQPPAPSAPTADGFTSPEAAAAYRKYGGR